MNPSTRSKENTRNGRSEKLDTETAEFVKTPNKAKPQLEKRKPKVTTKFKEYRLAELDRQRKISEREVKIEICRIKAKMSNDSYVDKINDDISFLNYHFKNFQTSHEKILELVNEEEKALESQIYDKLLQEIVNLQTLTERWSKGVKSNTQAKSTKSVTTNRSKSSKSSNTSTKSKLIEAKAKQNELLARVASFQRIENAAENARRAAKEVERLKLMAEYEAATAVTRVYEDADRDSDQDLGSDDPDSQIQHITLPPLVNTGIPSGQQQSTEDAGIPTQTLLDKSPAKLVSDNKLLFSSGPELNQDAHGLNKDSVPVFDPPSIEELFKGHNLNDNSNTEADTFNMGQTQFNRQLSSHDKKVPASSTPSHQPAVSFAPSFAPNLQTKPLLTPSQFVDNRAKSVPSSTILEPPTTLWEKMELRMSQPPPRPTPFDGNPGRYLKFRSNFRDQVESKPLTDSEKMSYLMPYTTGKAKSAIAYYEGLPNGCRLALNVLHQRFGQTPMIVQALKSSVIEGPRLKPNDNAGLLIFSDKLENCYWSMKELKSSELDCTTNLKMIYDRLPDSLQRKWRKEAKSYRLRSNEEPTLKELCAFVASEALTENDPVYGPLEKPTPQDKAYNARSRRSTPQRFDTTKVTTLATHVESASTETNHIKNTGHDKCELCKGEKHDMSSCPSFNEKGVNWRRKFARSHRLCYRCLSSRHIQINCKDNPGCQVKGCSSPSTHHSLLHFERKSDNNWTGSTNTTSDKSNRNLVMLKVVPLRVTARDGNTVTTYGLLDSAAVTTMVTSKLASKLDLKGTPERININTVVQSNHTCVLPRVEFDISPVTTEEVCLKVNQALTVDELNIPGQYCPDHQGWSTWSHLEDVNFPSVDVDISEVSILIGQDVPQAHVVLEYRWGNSPSNQPYAMKTPFGWCLAGPTGNKDAGCQPVALTVLEPREEILNVDTALNNQVERFWSLENHGFGDTNTPTDSVEDERSLKILEETTKCTKEGYEIGLLWKHDKPSLPENKALAERRLKQLERRLTRDKEFAKKYKSVMDDYIQKGYAKKLSNDEAEKTSETTWYLPHHGVVNPNKSKIRVVFDAAAEYRRVSLNKELLQGPQLTNNLLGVLLRFRQECIALTSDIESMFHRVRCREEDTDALRFFWWSEGFENPPTEHKMLVHLFGKSDSPCIAAWALKKTAEDYGHEFSEDVCKIVDRNFYVDDCLVSVPTVDEAIKLSEKLPLLLKKGNFRLTKFASNNKEVLAAIPSEERTNKDLDLDSVHTERALGVQWDIGTDSLGVKQSSISHATQDTRRECLSVLSSTFDPFGITAPVLLTAKRLIQRTWQMKLGWDDELPDELLEGWRNWKTDLALLNQVQIPRCFFHNGCHDAVSLQLHHFSDASEIGYGTVTYLRKESANGNVECAFVMCKSRTTPLKYVSMPRLELQAATIAVRVNNLIMREIDLNITGTFFWTDSKLTLQYIHNECRRFKTYVANRVAEIRNSSSPNMWRHCPGEQNPADDASRGLSPHEIPNKERWLHGPSFLLQPEDHWPNEESGKLPDDEIEIKSEKPIFSTLTTPTSLTKLLTRYSSWSTLLRKISWLLKFKKFIQYRSIGKRFDSTDKKITTHDLELSKEAVVKLVQSQEYNQEVRDLLAKRMISQSSSLVKLGPVLVDGVLRVGGRIIEASIPFHSRYPMILPPGHYVTGLLIAHYHEKLAHAGQDHILSHIREKFWIPKGRSAVRKVVRACLSCRKYHAVRMEQMMAALPPFRVTAFEPCFTHTGVDYFGPLIVKKGRSQVKRWGAIFTCLNSRAVHLEVASSLETDCFINLLRRFINRRGAPRFIYSDNGTNFVGADRELKTALQEWNQAQIEKDLLQRGTQWVFQPPKASHASGVWERLIRSTRKSLKAILKEGLVDDEVLTTVFTEVEAVLNSRPLCAASDDPNDCEPLTPNHLLLQRPMASLPPGLFVENDIYSRKKWKQVQCLATHFWSRWLREYLPALQERQKWQRPRRNARVGDLVLLVDESLPRGKWPLGRIVSTYVGRDGLVRTVEVKTKTSTLQRPIQKLCLLEEAQD